MMMGFGFGGFGMLFTLFFWILLVGLVVWAVVQFLPKTANRSTTNGTVVGPISRQESALDVLKQRYARGEISKAEYEAMRADLEA